MASRTGAKIIAFINEKIFRRTKQSSILLVQAVAVAGAFGRQTIRSLRKKPLKLQQPNNTIGFPLTNRWSNPDPALSQQAIYMVVKQLQLNNKSSGVTQKALIDSQKDRSKQTINVMNLLHSYNFTQMEVIQRILQKFDQLQEPVYNFDRQSIYAESHINGQHSFNLRKFHGNPQYDLPQSKSIEEDYINAFKKAMNQEKINEQNLKTAGITLESLKDKIFSTGQGVYSMLFQHLQRLSKGKILQNKPTIYLGNNQIKDTYYLQSCYPIYVKVNNPKTQKETFICAAIGFRYEGGNKIRFFSPFFSSQDQKLWRLAQNHLGQAIFNDFHIRVHLGIYHFTTNQYNVPIYNYLEKLSFKQKERYRDFLANSYSLFNRGLQGVNVAATATLVHPLDKYSLINTVFNFSQENAINLYANYTSRLDLTKYSPREIIESRGITKESADKDLDRLSLDVQLYAIISKYIENVYNLFQIQEFASGLKDEVNSQLKNMRVKGLNERPGVQSKEDVLKLLKNLMYCWIGYHTHTFSTIVLANYWLLRPSILRKPIPYNPSEWNNIVIGQQIPDSKIIMQSGKLTQATTQRDTSNEVLGILSEQAFRARLERQKYLYTNKQRSEKFQKLEKIINETISQLKQFGQKVNQVNKKRQDTIVFTWMRPQRMQISLNV